MSSPISLASPLFSCLRFPTLIESTTLSVVTALSVQLLTSIYTKTENGSFKEKASLLLRRITTTATTILSSLSLFAMTQKKHPHLSLAGLAVIVFSTLYFTTAKDEDFSIKYKIISYVSACMLNLGVTTYFFYQQRSLHNALRLVGSMTTPMIYAYGR